MYLSHFMYHGLVTTLHTLYLLDIFMMMYVSFLFLYTCLFFYITCLHFTLDALMDFV